GLDVLAGNDLGAYGRLDGDVEHLAGNQPAHLGDHFAAAIAGIRAMDDHGQGVDAVAVDQQVDAHDVGGPVLLELVVHRGVAARHRLELVEEVEHALGQRHVVGQVHLPAVVGHVQLYAPLGHAQ